MHDPGYLGHYSDLVMALGGFTLADRLGAKAHPCKVAGCTRTFIELPGKALGLGTRRAGEGKDAPGDGMCDPCRAKLATLADKERRCDTPGCHGKWNWPVAAQLEAFAAHRPPPRGICAECERTLASFEEKEVDCGIPGCGRKALLTKRAQLIAARAPAPAAEPHPEAHDGEGAPASLAESAAPVAARESAEGRDAASVNEASGSAAAAPNGHAETSAEETVAHPNGHAGTSAEETVAQASDTERTGQSARAPGRSGDRKGAPRADKPPEKDKSARKVTFKGPFCAPCTDVAKRLQDRAVACGIQGCKRKWVWKADEQIQAFAAGKPNEPPRRMCEECRTSFGKLVDREVRCRTSGCKKTWTWSRFDQLDACVADKPPPKAPSRMCNSCYGLFSALKDVERPCRKSGCKRTWTDKRGAQLARLARGKTGDPYPQYCSEHQKELGDLEDREITCKTEGCSGTWTWSREQQLAAGVRPEPKREEVAQTAPASRAEAAPGGAAEGSAGGAETSAGEVSSTQEPGEAAAGEPSAQAEPAAAATQGSAAPQGGRQGGRQRRDRGRRRRQPQPPGRLCGACAEFLKDRKTLEIPCQQCTTPIYWPPESQLQTHLGNWAAPTLCGACKRDATERAREAAREALRHPEPETEGNNGEPAPGVDAVKESTAEAEAVAAPDLSAGGAEAAGEGGGDERLA